MKRNFIFIILISVLFSQQSFARQLEGSWHGLLKVQGMELMLVFNISETGEGLQATMDSPGQGAYGIAVDETTFEDSTLKMIVRSAAIEYTGKLKEGVFEGTFTQAGMEFPLVLSREKPEKTAIARAQEPRKPYPYHSEDVVFHNPKAGITLAGTLTLPSTQGFFPAVVMITGSGPQNRDGEIMGHKPFLVIADHLTRNGIAVLRFDDRGVAESESDFASATSYDFATDVEAAVDFLRGRPEINRAKIGLVGHSEGGIIAPIVASQNPDKVSYIVSLAGTGIRGDLVLLEQQVLVAKAMGIPEEDIGRSSRINRQAFDMIQEIEDTETLKTSLRQLIEENLDESDIPGGMAKEQFVNQQVAATTSPWMLTFLRLDPARYLEKVQCPVLAVNGSNDLQVVPSNLQAIEAALHRGGNHNVTLVEFSGLNHLFQECETGSPANYATIEQTFAPVVLETMSLWIKEQTRR